ncbi:Retrovirus-related Pol polyprotein from type-1 retrotransposable element R1 [Araneus ventricosus]|uniref:Retrovirus-related Pol polyprotein from type-1 retrotransposable element R1 n=1 Tax=Araneus ventricosus TaxID=182803 RepID=A0A4Y2FZ02_ARAVE|nr:Retrovirus-related Pol polyprotein from type-1 retrotransposable element R1 [Araneus ventricosus]
MTSRKMTSVYCLGKRDGDPPTTGSSPWHHPFFDICLLGADFTGASAPSNSGNFLSRQGVSNATASGMLGKTVVLLRNYVPVVLVNTPLRIVPEIRLSAAVAGIIILGIKMGREYQYTILPFPRNVLFTCANARLFNQTPNMPLSVSPLFSWWFFQGNLGRSQVATQELPHLCFPFVPDIYLLQEPYLAQGNPFGLRLGWRTVMAKSGKALISIRNPDIHLLIRHEGEHVIALEAMVGSDSITVVCFYFPPSLPQARMGGPMVDLILARRLHVWNDPSSPPTFETERGRSWIDITLSTPLLSTRKGDWIVHRTTLSDHNPITFIINGCVGEPSPSSYGRLSPRRILKVAREVASFYHQFAPEIEGISTKHQLDMWIDRITHFIQSISVFNVSPKNCRLRVPWWDSSLDIQRKKTRALRARFLRCRHPQERLHRRIVFKKEAARYKYMIKTKSRQCFNQLCAQLTRNNPFDLPYRLVARKILASTILRGVKDDNGVTTTTVSETVSTIVHKLFPRDDATSDTPSQKAIRYYIRHYENQVIDPPFYIAEIQGALHAFRPKKAPGLDGVSVELVKGIFKCCPAFILSLMIACLRVRGFPTSWKVSKLILLGKPGRDLTLPQSYRPICLLTVFSKLLDKLLTHRLTNLFYSKGLLNDRQHGFRIGKSCETANNALWEDIQEALRCKGKVCLISLDVQGAFDTVWQQSVLYRLIAAQCPFNIFAMVRDYFQDRTVQYHFNNNYWSFPDTGGVPQGSCSGPFYWNIVLDTIFAVDLPTGCSVQAFADDLILLVRGETKRDIELKSGVALERLVSWAHKHKLQFNSGKTLLMPLTFGGRLTLVDPPRVFPSGAHLL